MFKIFPHTFNRQGFLSEVLILDLVAPAGDPFFVTPRGMDLLDPPGIPVAGRPDQDVLGEAAELKALDLASGRFSHNPFYHGKMGKYW